MMDKKHSDYGSEIVVIIPALNEEEAIGHVVRDVPELVSKIIVVDNGSTDRTVEKAQEAGAVVVHELQKGYGYACLKGMEQVDDENVIVFLDGDYSDFPEEMVRLIDPILSGEADLVIGSRLSGERERGAMLPHALVANVIFSLLLRLFCGLRVTDIGPFRAIRKDKLIALELKEYTYGWTLEMMIKAARLGLKVMEVPVSYRRRLGHSKVSGSLWVSLKVGAKMFSTMRYCWQ
jgi:glycosyltransferase involved in cell wall biosynthesis